MQLRWTEEAADDLERIANYLLVHGPDPAVGQSSFVRYVRVIFAALVIFVPLPSARRAQAKPAADGAI